MSTPLQNKSTTMNITEPTQKHLRTTPRSRTTFLRIHKQPFRQDRDALQKSIEHVLVGVRIPWFNWAKDYGLITEERTKADYKRLSGPYWTDPGEEPNMTDPSITESSSDYEKETRVEWNVQIMVHITRHTLWCLQEHSRYSQQSLLWSTKRQHHGLQENTILEYFKNINSTWCKTDTKEVKKVLPL